MKIIPVFWITILSAGLVWSCAKDADSGDAYPEEQSVVIEFNAGLTRAAVEGDQRDNEINTLRVLVYDSESGDLKFNIALPATSTDDNPTRLVIAIGTYDFVFIANEDSDEELKTKLTSVVNGAVGNIDRLRALSFDRTAFDAGKAIPMVKFFEQIEVSGENTIKTQDMENPVTGVWDVSIERIAVRLRLTFTMTERVFERWVEPEYIALDNIAGNAYLLPGIDNSAERSGTAETFTAAIAGTEPGLISDVDQDGNVTVVYDRLILPESVLLSSENNTAENAMVMSLNFGDLIKSGTVNAPEGYGFGSLPASHSLLTPIRLRKKKRR